MNDFLNKIHSCEKIVLACHQKPDGDAVGSTLATAMSLSLLNKKVSVLIEEYSERFNIIEGKEFIVPSIDFVPDVFICLDCADKYRIGADAVKVFEKSLFTINIDHHISNTNFADMNIVMEKSSTSEMVFELFNEAINIDNKIASAIYAGIIYDTGGLRFPSTTVETMRIAANLMAAGIDFNNIYTQLMTKHSLSEVMALKRGIENMIADFDNNIAISTFTLAEYHELSVDMNDLDSIVQFLINIDDIQTAVFIYEKEPDIFKVSLRSNIIDVRKIAVRNNGGGHIRAAGCTIHGSKDLIVNTIKNQILSAMVNENGR